MCIVYCELFKMVPMLHRVSSISQMTGIIGPKMQRQNCVNTQHYCMTVAKVCGTWCTKNNVCALFTVDPRSDKMTLKKNQC